jgi:hypothetical protein
MWVRADGAVTIDAETVSADRDAARARVGDPGGWRVPVARPRRCAIDGSGELAVASYSLFSQTEVVGRMAMGRTLAGMALSA